MPWWLFLLLTCTILSAAEFPSIRLHNVLTGLDLPVDIATARDGSGRLFIIEQRGRIRIVKNGALLPQPFLDVRSKVSCCGERGLLGLAFPPNYASKRHFYINYTNTQGNTVVARVRASANPDVADASSEETILGVAQPYSNHNGGGVVFGPKDGYLYIGLGDGGSGGDPQNNGQRGDALLGKMLRIDVESDVQPYSVPPTNPFLNRAGFRPEIWATGLRNPWRYAFDRETGDLYIADVGQNRAEEVSFQPGTSQGGENYGWRIMEGLQCYPSSQSCSRDGLVLPLLEYGRSSGCSVTGGFVYRGQRFPALRGIYLYADYCSGNVWGLQREGANWENRLLIPATGMSISTFGEDETGELYLTNHERGDIHLITAGTPATSADGVVNAASFSAGIVPGSLATLYGTALTAFGGIVGADRTPLPTTLSGTSVTLNGIAAPLVGVAYVGSQEQINFQVPWELAGQSRASLVVTANGQSSSPVEIPIVTAQPEVFVVREEMPAVTTSGGRLISPADPVEKGSVVTIYATGLGQAGNAPPTGQAANAQPLAHVTGPVQVRIDGIDAPVSFAGLVPNFVGLYQINATIPVAVPTGSADLTVVAGATSSRTVKLAVR